VHHIRPLPLGDEASRLILGQAFLHRRQDLVVLSLGIKILQLCPQVGPLLGGGGESEFRNWYYVQFVRIHMICSASQSKTPINKTRIQDC